MSLGGFAVDGFFRIDRSGRLPKKSVVLRNVGLLSNPIVNERVRRAFAAAATLVAKWPGSASTVSLLDTSFLP
jgi:hypothetical protein